MAPAIKFVLASSLDCGKPIVRAASAANAKTSSDDPTDDDRFICSVERPVADPETAIEYARRGRLYRCMRCSCSTYFATFPEFKFHLALAHPSLRLKYVCRVCGKGFATANVRNKHRKIQHAGAKAIEDDDGDGGDDDDADRNNRQRSLHRCDKCERGFRDPDNLKRHLATVHRAADACPRPHKCDRCDKAYSRKDHLKQHRATSHVDAAESSPRRAPRQHTCASCGKAFRRKDSFRYHERHKPCALAENRLACDRCGREFRRRCDLSRHQCATCQGVGGADRQGSSILVEMGDDDDDDDV